MTGGVPPHPSLWWTMTRRSLLLVAFGIALYTTGPLLVDVFASAQDLERVAPWWFVVMVLLEAGSFAAAWGLARLAVRGLTWGVASMAQLTANSAAHLLPGGAVMAGAVYYRMLTRAGTHPGEAAAALTVNALISDIVLFALPATAAIVASATAPVPAGLIPLAASGVVLFVALLAMGLLAALFDAPLRWIALAAGFVVSRVGALRKRSVEVRPDAILAQRDEVLAALGHRWLRALILAATNWLLDYLVLMTALYAVGARPRLSMVLLAYSAAAVLAMVPITPGGLGFVEAGLTATLTAAGVPVAEALLATLAYRLVAFWLPIPAGGAAYVAFRRRYPGPQPVP